MFLRTTVFLAFAIVAVIPAFAESGATTPMVSVGDVVPTTSTESAAPTTSVDPSPALDQSEEKALRSVSTGFLLTVRREYLASMDPAERAGLVAVVDDRIAQWERFGTSGGASRRVLRGLRYLRRSLSTLIEQENTRDSKSESAGMITSTTVVAFDKPDDNAFNDTYPPACNFKVTRFANNDNKVIINSYNYFDYKDPVSGLASGAVRIRFSNDRTNWKEFTVDGTTPDIPWDLAQGPVPKRIYMQACDKAGNWGNSDGGPANCHVVTLDF